MAKSAPSNAGQKIVGCSDNSCRYEQCKKSPFENRYSAFFHDLVDLLNPVNCNFHETERES